MSAELSLPERRSRDKHEQTIERGMSTFVDVGRALMAIRDERLYRSTHETFEAYCGERWQLGRSHAYRMIDAATVVEIVSPQGDTVPSERVARALVPLRKQPEALVAAWSKAVSEHGTRPTPEQVRRIVQRRPAPGDTPHPAKFSDAIVPHLVAAITGLDNVLDPFAGTGRIHEVADLAGVKSVGIELEPEWAKLHRRTKVGNALDLPFEDGTFACVCTSPCYGNRFADHHDAQDGSERHSYTHDLGHELTPDNAGALQWGDEYRKFHDRAWREAYRVLAYGGRFVLNVSDHIREREQAQVCAWHVNFWTNELHAQLVQINVVETHRMRYGENADARTLAEFVFVFDLVEAS